MSTIEDLVGKPLHEMSEEELLAFVQDGRQGRTTLMEMAALGGEGIASTKKDKPLPTDLLDLLEDF